MTFIIFLIVSAILPLKNYTNYSLVFDVYENGSRVYVATNGGVISFEDIRIEGDSSNFMSFLTYTSSNGLPHNIIESITGKGDTVFAIPINSGIYYHTPGMAGFYRYFIPYSSINTAKGIRVYKDLLFVQLNGAILRIRFNGNLNPDDDVIYTITTDSTGVMELYQDTLYYSVKDTLYALPVYSQVTAYSMVFPSNISSIYRGQELYVGTKRGFFGSYDNFSSQKLNSYTYGFWEKGDTLLIGSDEGGYIMVNNALTRVCEKTGKVFVSHSKMLFNRITTTDNMSYNGGLWVFFNGKLMPLPRGIGTNFVTSLDVLNNRVYFGTLDWNNKPEFLPSKAFCINTLENRTYPVENIGNSTAEAIRSVRAGNHEVFIGAYSLNSIGLFIVSDTTVKHLTDFPSLLFTDFSIGRDTILALWGDGIYRWHGNQKTLLYPLNYPSYVVVDSENRVWVGTEASGMVILKMDGEIIRAVNYELPSPAITSLLALKDYVIAGTDAGLTVFDKNTVPHILLSGKHIRSLAEDKFGRAYALTDSSLYFINPEDNSCKVLLSSPPIVPTTAADWEVRNVMAVDDSLNLYIGGKEGILVVKLEEPAHVKSTSISIFPNPVIHGEPITICADNDFKVLSVSHDAIGEYQKGCHKIGTSDLAPGLYLVLTDNGERGKFVIKE